MTISNETQRKTKSPVWKGYIKCGQIFSYSVWIIFFPLPICHVGICVRLCLSNSNRVEAWTRDVQFLLRQEGRPVTKLVGNTSTVRIMKKDWENTDKAAQWIRQRAASSQQPFALYLGLNLPHPYRTESLGPTAGGSTFLTSPYWLKKALWLTYFMNVPHYHKVIFYVFI